MSGFAGNAQLRRLLDAVMSVSSGLELRQVLEQIVEAARDLVDARYGALGVLDPSGTYLSDFITVGLDDTQERAIGAPPKGHGILGLLILEPHPLRLAELGDHPDSFGFPSNHPPMSTFLGVPVRIRGEVFGNLYLTDKVDGGGFSDIDEELVTSLAGAAAIAIENARLHERMREVSLLADRERIAHDLHDTVIQRLVAAGMSLQAMMRLVDRPELSERLTRVVDDLDQTVRDLRSTIFELDQRGPTASLRRDILDVVAEAGRALGFEPQVRFDGPVDTAVDSELAGTVLAVIREALSNVVRHASARRAEVAISVVSGALLLEIRDDGIGVGGPATGGSGLRNMQTRAEAIGGTFAVQAVPDGGSLVQWSVPLP